MLRSILLLALALATPAAAQSPDLAGMWTGAMVKAHDPLPVTMSFSSGPSGWSGSFGSDAQQAADIPLHEIRDQGSSVHFELVGDDETTSFNGTLTGDSISGAFSAGNVSGTFHLTRDLHPPTPERTRDVVFASGPIRLGGTLLLPVTGGLHPAIVFLQGSGPEGRWANRWLAEQFARAGFVALIFDKRGVGRSGGDWHRAGFDTLAQDGAAAVRFVRSQPEVNPAKVGIYGHSQGGSVAPLVAGDAGHLAFLIASSAPGLSPADVETYSVSNSIGIADLAPAEQADARAFVRAIIDVGYRGAPRAELDSAAAKYKGRSWFFEPPPADNSYWAMSRAISGFKPVEAWSRVKAPVLLVYGLHDERVPALPSLAVIRGSLEASGNHKVDVKIYSDADHIFDIVGSDRSGGWLRREPDYARVLTSWAASMVAA